MKKYTAPEIDLIVFETEDVLGTNSGSFIVGEDETPPVFPE